MGRLPHWLCKCSEPGGSISIRQSITPSTSKAHTVPTGNNKILSVGTLSFKGGNELSLNRGQVEIQYVQESLMFGNTVKEEKVLCFDEWKRVTFDVKLPNFLLLKFIPEIQRRLSGGGEGSDGYYKGKTNIIL